MHGLDLESFDKTTVSSRLHRWGIWKMKSGVALGYPSMSAFMNLSGRSTLKEYIGDEVDSECTQTDDAVGKLYFFPRSALYVEYVIGTGKKICEKAHLCGCHRTAYYKYLDDGHAGVANILNKMLHTADETGINLLNVS